jgi:hypothetical protein
LTFASFRYYVGLGREESLLAAVKARLSNLKAHDFEILSLEPHHKDGGVFVKFCYSSASTGDQASALATIEKDLRNNAQEYGGFPSWTGLTRGDIWLVKGRPWREVKNKVGRSD